MKLLIIAGGTGGHIFPALTIAETLQKQGVLIEWIGTEAGMEKNLVGNRFPLHFLSVKTFRGKNIFAKIAAPFRLLRAVWKAYFLIRKINPDCVLGMGGYASGPSGMASSLLRKKLIIHEQNAKAGLTNRWLSYFATTILQAFPNTFSVPAITVGNPVRESIVKITHDYSARQKPWRILILGGSQGAHTINCVVSDWMLQTSDRASFLIWHQTGKKDFEIIQKKYEACAASIYHVSPFIDNMDEAYAWADCVIARSGALTVAEIAAAGLPSILIPYPYAADDHQYANALFLQRANAGVVFRESEFNVEKLAVCVSQLFSDVNQLRAMAEKAKSCAVQDSTEKIIHLL